MNCDREPQLHAYHDGELNAADRAAFESHLASCADCSAALAELRSMSAFFAETPRTNLSQIARRRLDDRVDAMLERSLVRFAWSLSGIAAAVLIVGSAWLMQTTETPAAAPSNNTVAAAPPWVEAVVASRSNGDVAVTPAAQWYLADASSRSDELP